MVDRTSPYTKDPGVQFPLRVVCVQMVSQSMLNLACFRRYLVSSCLQNLDSVCYVDVGKDSFGLNQVIIIINYYEYKM